MSAADTGIPIEPKPLSEMDRLVGVFTSPSTAFADIRRSAMWVVPWLVMAILSVVFVFTIDKKVGFEQVMQNQMRMASASQQARIDQLPADQKERVMKQQVMGTRIFSYAWPVVMLIFLVIVALIMWGTFSFGAGADVKFGQSLAIVMYASLPGCITSLIAIIMLSAGMDSENFMIQNPVGTNIGYFLSFADTPRFIYSMATSIDVIKLWIMFLTAVGFSAVGKVKRSTSMAIVYGWYFFIALVGAGFAAAFS